MYIVAFAGMHHYVHSYIVQLTPLSKTMVLLYTATVQLTPLSKTMSLLPSFSNSSVAVSFSRPAEAAGLTRKVLNPSGGISSCITIIVEVGACTYVCTVHIKESV